MMEKTGAVIDAHTTGIIATERFPASSVGYDEALAWVESLTQAGERAWAVEGTASYGRGLTVALERAGEWVIEFDRPREKATKDGTLVTSDPKYRTARKRVKRAQRKLRRERARLQTQSAEVCSLFHCRPPSGSV